MYKAPESPWLVPFDGSFRRSDFSTRRPDDAPGKKERREILADRVAELDRLQRIFYAHDRHSMLLVFQGMDAAGKDGTIRSLLQGVNPAGCQVSCGASEAHADRPVAAAAASTIGRSRGERERGVSFIEFVRTSGVTVVAMSGHHHVELGIGSGDREGEPVLDREAHVGEMVIVVDLVLVESALEPRRVAVGGVGGDLRAEQIQRHAEVEVHVLLERAQIDDAVLAHIVRLELRHNLAGSLQHPREAGEAHDTRLTQTGQKQCNNHAAKYQRIHKEPFCPE